MRKIFPNRKGRSLAIRKKILIEKDKKFVKKEKKKNKAIIITKETCLFVIK